MNRDESARGRKLSRAIKNARKKKGLTQQELAGKLGVSYETIAKIEKKSTRSPGFFLVLDIAQTIDLDVKDFFKRSRGKT